MLVPAGRSGWVEIERCYRDVDARAEAARCLKCNLAAEIADPVPTPAS